MSFSVICLRLKQVRSRDLFEVGWTVGLIGKAFVLFFKPADCRGLQHVFIVRFACADFLLQVSCYLPVVLFVLMSASMPALETVPEESEVQSGQF